MPSSFYPIDCFTATCFRHISWPSLGSSQTIIGKLHERKMPNILITNELWHSTVVKAFKAEEFIYS
jgi:hypothetical protein